LRALFEEEYGGRNSEVVRPVAPATASWVSFSSSD
jgi:hypothetical protein